MRTGNVKELFDYALRTAKPILLWFFMQAGDTNVLERAQLAAPTVSLGNSSRAYIVPSWLASSDLPTNFQA